MMSVCKKKRKCRESVFVCLKRKREEKRKEAESVRGRRVRVRSNRRDRK